MLWPGSLGKGMIRQLGPGRMGWLHWERGPRRLCVPILAAWRKLVEDGALLCPGLCVQPSASVRHLATDSASPPPSRA